jgi:hypothetical protein
MTKLKVSRERLRSLILPSLYDVELGAIEDHGSYFTFEISGPSVPKDELVVVRTSSSINNWLEPANV